MSDFTVGEIKRLLQARCPALLHELVPRAKREGTVFSAPNPTRGADTPGSFKVWPNGVWREYDESEDVGRGDIINLIAYVNGYAPKSTEGRRFALQWARSYLGLSDMTPAARAAAHRRGSKESEARRAKQEREEMRRIWRHRERARSILAAAADIQEGDDVDAYLMARGIDLAEIPELTPGILRRHPRLQHWIDDARPYLPAMVAAVMGPKGAQAVHCTFLAPPFDGRPSARKADVTPPKLILGQVQGAVVPLTLGGSRLSVREAIAQGRCDTVVLCEGIETGLSIALAVTGPDAPRVWACLALGHIGHAPVDWPCVGAIVVAIENDTKPEAIRQRDKVLEKLEACGKPVSTMRPHVGVDANDLLMGG